MEKEIEIWKDVFGYEGLYRVSNMGNVKSLGNGLTHKTEKILKPHKSRKYIKVILSKNGVVKNHLVHKIEWEAFYGEIPEGYQVNHIDEKPENNRLDNLCLMTPKENCNWGTRNERVSKKQINDSNKSKPVIQYDLNGNYIKEYPSAHEIERQLGFDNGHISKCCNGKLKKTYGYIWRFKENYG